jgi:hypothetical protein
MSFQIDVNVNMRDWPQATRAGVSLTQREIRNRTREQIRSTGMSRAARGLNTKVTKVAGGWMLQVLQSPSFLKVFEYGGTSVGKPLLWIPVEPALRGVRARTLTNLFRPGGKNNRRNVLISKTDGKVKYVGVRSITNRPRFRIREIAKQEAAKFLERLAI